MNDKDYIKVEISNNTNLADAIVVASGFISVAIILVALIIFYA